ncbi:MAG TPA: Spy/CpxP family protein refolding chaperone [Burkholderiaceae bacterium]
MKKTWLKRTLLGVAVSTALLGTVAAYSQGTGFHHGPPTPEQIAQHEQHMLDHVGKKLNLDANQAAKLKALADLAVADHKPAAGATDPHARMAALISGTTFDRAGAQALANQHVAKIQADAPGLINAFGDFYDSLNATQQSQLRELAAHHHGGMFMFGMGGFGPGGEHGHHGPHGASDATGS